MARKLKVGREHDEIARQVFGENYRLLDEKRFAKIMRALRRLPVHLRPTPIESDILKLRLGIGQERRTLEDTGIILAGKYPEAISRSKIKASHGRIRKEKVRELEAVIFRRLRRALEESRR